MSTPNAPGAANAPTAPNTAPAAGNAPAPANGTPPAPAQSRGATDTPGRIQRTRPGQQPVRQVIVKPRRLAIDTAPPASGTPAPAAPTATPPQVGSPPPGETQKPAGAAPTPPAGDAKPPAAAAPTKDEGGGAKPAAGDSAPSAPPAPEKPKEGLTDAEESARMARISRAVTEHQQRVATDRQAMANERAQLDGEKRMHADNLRKVAILDQVQRQPPQSWLRVMQQVFGVQPGVLLDELRAYGAQTPEQRAAFERQHYEQQQSAAQQQRDNEVAQLRTEVQNGRIEQWKRENIAPLLADKAAYSHLHAALGDSATNQVFDLVSKRWDLIQAGRRGETRTVNGRQVPPHELAALPLHNAKTAADQLEAHFRDFFGKAPGAKPPAPAAPAPPAPPAPPPTKQADGPQNTPPGSGPPNPPPRRGRWEPPKSPYTRKRIT